jgi:hypothetical protein
MSLVRITLCAVEGDPAAGAVSRKLGELVIRHR